MNRRNRERGDGDGCAPTLVAIMLTLIFYTLTLNVAAPLKRAATALERIAAATCIYAPPAEPVVDEQEGE